MYNDTLHSLEIPCKGQRVLGHSQSDGHVLLTCVVDRVIRLEMNIEKRVVQVDTLEGRSCVVHVLPENANLDSGSYRSYKALRKMEHAARRGCGECGCACDRQNASAKWKKEKWTGFMMTLLSLATALGLRFMSPEQIAAWLSNL